MDTGAKLGNAEGVADKACPTQVYCLKFVATAKPGGATIQVKHLVRAVASQPAIFGGELHVHFVGYEVGKEVGC